jgi:hypothetical protein
VIRNWRAWVLFVLFAGPIAIYVVFGSVWLWEHGWLVHAALVWMGIYVLFTLLADRWTKSTRSMLPPLDWNAPKTFAPRDKDAWAIVEEEAAAADQSSLDDLTKFDLLSETGQRLARRLAAHYYPRSSDPVEEVPIVELLTALELAAEDLRSLCQEVPGGDMITPGHFKQAVQAANFIQRANEVYTYLLPVFSPFTGLARLGTQKLIATPAWRNAQRTALQWFFRAYVNRLGTHLIELYSGRLAIGADAYRSLTRADRPKATHDAPKGPVAAVVGAKGTGKSVLIAGLEKEMGGELSAPLRARLLAVPGADPLLPTRLARLAYDEIGGYPAPGTTRESKLRRARDEAAEQAAERGDLLILLVDASRGDPGPELEFLDRWRAWFDDKPSLEPPPALVVVTGMARMAVDEPAEEPDQEVGGVVTASTAGVALREKASAAWVEALEKRLGTAPTRPRVVVLNLDAVTPPQIADTVMPAVAGRLAEVERSALLRHFHRTSMRSKARRVFEQASRQGVKLWGHLRSPKAGS